MTALVGLPWIVQPLLWGPALDRAVPFRMGPRRAPLAAGFAGSQLCLGALLLLPDGRSLGVVGAILLAHSVFASLVDTAADRMIVAHAPAGELGRTSALTRGAFLLGAAGSAALFGPVLAAWPWRAAVALLVALSAVAALGAVLVRERRGDAFLSVAVAPEARAGEAANWAAGVRDFLRSLLGRETAPLLALCFGLDFALALFATPFPLLLIQGHGWDAAGLSSVQASVALGAGTAGAFGVGYAVDRIGARRALVGLFAAAAAAFAATAALVAAGLAGAAGPAVLALTGATPPLVFVALLPAVALASAGPGPATRFQVFMAAMNAGEVAGAAASGSGPPPAVAAALAAAVFGLAAALVAWRPNRLFPPAREP